MTCGANIYISIPVFYTYIIPYSSYCFNLKIRCYSFGSATDAEIIRRQKGVIGEAFIAAFSTEIGHQRVCYPVYTYRIRRLLFLNYN